MEATGEYGITHKCSFCGTEVPIEDMAKHIAEHDDLDD